VELAMVAPLLGILMMGMFEISRAMTVVEMLDNAARKGCNTGIKPGKTYTDLTNDIKNLLSSNNFDQTQAIITVKVATYVTPATSPPTWGSWTTATSDATYNPNQFDLVSVQVSYPISKAGLWFGAYYLAGSGLQYLQSSTVVMMRAG
jgi:Flp pilus assembly protein TadG